MLKNRRIWQCIFGLAGLSGLALQAQAATVKLPVEAAHPPGSSTVRGMLVRTAQAPADAAVPASLGRAIQQLNGTLKDASGQLIANEAVEGPNADGSYPVEIVNFEKDANPFDAVDADQNLVAQFYPEVFPGIPGMGGHTDKFAVEVIAFLELTAGTNTFGINVGTDRTDVNDDDSFVVYVAANPHDYFGTKVAEFERFAPAFQSNTHNETLFTVEVPITGIYPFRIVYWQGGRGANLQWYHVYPETGERLLINDPNDTRALKAYRNSTVALANAPAVVEASPSPDSDGNSASAPIEILVKDGSTTVTTNTIKLYLNEAQVQPQTITKSGKNTSIVYSPNASRSDVDNRIKLEFTDSASATYTKTWRFGIITSGGSATKVTGQWDFERGDLSATVGKALEYLDGPEGLTKQGTEFGTTTELGVPDINGKPAKVMKVPGDVIREIGYIMDHGIAPNGGGTRVNQFTLIMDVMVGTSGPGAASMLQISSLNNTDDGDLFWQGSNFGQGTDGYKGTGIFLPGEWHRVVAAYDLAANPPVVTKFVDGIKQDDWTFGQSLDNPRRALQPTAILFADGDQDERREWWVNSIQIRSGKLSDVEMVLLGGPSADGIPAEIPQSNVTGQWDFNRGDLSATIGKPLQYLDGPEGLTKQLTLFGTTTELGVLDINGQEAKVMYVPGDVIREIGYLMDHGIAPNGGGTRVNQYTLIMDVMVGTTGPGAASMLQVSSVNNTDDGDLFWQGSNFGQGTDGYVGTGIFLPGEWHRVIAAYDLAANPPVVTKFVDGIKQDDWTFGQTLDHPRRALQPTAVLFADGDQDERREWWVNSIQIRSGKLSDAAMVELGGPSADGIPILIKATTPPTLSISLSGNAVTISWPADQTGFTLESTPVLATPAWNPVPNVVNNTVTVTASGAAQFYRLRQ